MTQETKTGSFLGAPNPDRDTYTTPDWIADAVGPVWLDTCSNERSLMKAERTFRLDRGQNGLVLARFVPRNPPGIVWCNPPYSHGQVIQWVLAYRHTRFCFLLRDDSSTKWYEELFRATRIFARPMDRVDFDAPPGVDAGDSNPYPHTLFYRDPGDVTAEVARLCYLTEPARRPR